MLKQDGTGREWRRFDPEYRMTQSWGRLRSGIDIQEHDILTLRHELLEREYMKQGMLYEDAHAKANLKFNYEKLRKNGTTMVVSKLIKRTEDEIVYEYRPDGDLRPGYIYIDLKTKKVEVEPSPDDKSHFYLDHAYYGINSQYIQNNEFPEMDVRCWG